MENQKIILATASKAAKCLVAPIERQLDYLLNYHSNVEDLKIQLKMLGDVKGGVDQSVDIATRNGEDIEPDIEKWLESVSGINEVARKFLDDEKNAKKWYFNRLCPNLKSRYQLSKKAKKTAAEVFEIQDSGIFYTTKGYEAFESRMSTLKGIMEALTSIDIQIIGIYGIGGVGKTMLAKEVGKKSKEDQLFDEVVIVDISRTPNIKKIQGEIANVLGLKFDQETEPERAYRLCQRLGEVRILVILDDIWARLDLKAVGIPFKDEHEGKDIYEEGKDALKCKVVVISRNQDALRSDKMAAQMNFLVEVLPEKEAWNFFKKMAGGFVEVEASEVNSTVVELAKECAGLPLAIAALASALKNKSLPIWKDALQRLRLSTATSINGIDAKVYSSLKLSYSLLDCEEAKSLLLLCSLLPKDYHISVQDLLKYGKGLGLFRSIYKLEESRNRVYKLVQKLKASCLLLDTNITGLVKMHDVVHDFGISIASRDKQISIMRNAVELEEGAREEKFKICQAISLPYVDIHKLPTGLQCPKLELFLFFSNDPSLKIMDTFLEGMKQLKVLSLTNLCFSSLPSSLQFLSNLQTLCLEQCMLPPIPNLAIIGELKNLEFLSFESSNIEELPREIGQLTLLRLLDLRNCSKLKVIPSNVLERLSQLEDLYMGNSFVKWEVNGNASLVELKHLSRLVTLDIGITDAKILPKDFDFEKLMRYRIFIGNDWDWSGEYKTSRTLKLRLNANIQQELGINVLLKNAEDLYFYETKGIRSFLNDLDREGFSQLKHLHVENSSEIEYVVNNMESVPKKAFPNLKSLFLLNLNGLKEICLGQLPAESFRSLRMVKVGECDRLKYLFSLSMARSLLQLQEIEIKECKIIDEIVVEGREEAKDNNEVRDEILFPQLRYLTLKCLSELMSLCPKAKTMPSIPFSKQMLPTTNAGSEEIISKDKHDIPIPLFNKKVSFQSLKLLNIEKCNILRNLFSPSLALDLVELRALKITNCQMMEEIIENEKRAKEEVIEKFTFPLLDYIILEDLPNLISFNPGNHTFKCPSLKLMKITGCPKIKTFTSINEGFQETPSQGSLDISSTPLFNKKVAFPHLEELVIKSVFLKEIWNYPPPHSSFCKLKSLRVFDCENLLNIVPSSMLMRLQNLETLEVRNCGGSLKYLFELGGINDKERHVVRTTQLRYLYLYKVPRLEHIWKKTTLRFFPFQKLSSLRILGASDMKSIFTTSMAKSLVHLQVLEIKWCGLEEIVKKGEEDQETTDKIVFPRLTSMTLCGLYQLKSFCQGIYISEWPSLKALEVSHFEHGDMIFASELMNFKETREQGYHHPPIKQPLFLVEKVAFPSLESLYMVHLPWKELWHHQLPAAGSFCKLKSLQVQDCHSLLNVIPSHMLSTLQNLELLKVWNSYAPLEYIYDLGGLKDKEIHVAIAHQLRSLYLENVWGLKQIWKKDPQGIFPFQNLTSLGVGGCENLRNIFTTSIAKSLVQLQELSIIKCTRVGEIVGKEGVEKEAMDKIVFPLLTSLTLQSLAQLRSFCQGIHISEWPSLKELKVSTCPNVEIFASELSSFEERQPLFLVNKVAFPNLEELHLYDASRMKEIWQGQFHTPSFCKLRVLEVSACNHLTHLLPSEIARSLGKIKSIIVDNCKSMKEIIVSKEGEVVDETTFNQLDSLKLTNLPNLISFFHGSNTFSFPTLEEMWVENCSQLKTFSNGILNTPRLGKVYIGKQYTKSLQLLDKWEWKGDLNTTIQHLFEQQERFMEVKPKEGVVQQPAGSFDLTQTSSPHRKKCIDDTSGYISFMLYARSFFITWGDSPQYWTWDWLKETSGENMEVARLIEVCWLEVEGSFHMSDLSPGIVYEIVFVVKLSSESSGWDYGIALNLSLPSGKSQKREVNLLEKPREQWIELNVGNFITKDGETEEVHFNLTDKRGHWKRGLIVKGAIVRPKI